jgi:hypothetical protein
MHRTIGAEHWEMGQTQPYYRRTSEIYMLNPYIIKKITKCDEKKV